MKAPDEKIIAALLSSSTNQQAADACGISLKQLYNRMGTAEFHRKLSEAKCHLLDGATAAIQSRMGQAIDTMTKVMLDPNTPAQTRLNAAESVIRTGLRLTEAVDIEARMAELEAKMERIDSK